MSHLTGLTIYNSFLWLIVACIVSTRDVVLKFEDNSANVRDWVKTGNCHENGWRISEKYWHACHKIGENGGDCFLETLHWSTLNASMVYVNISVSSDCYPDCETDHDLALDLYTITDDNKSISKPSVVYDYDRSKGLYVVKTKIAGVLRRVKLKIAANKFCGWLQNITVYYKQCNEVSHQLATFQPVVAPNDTMDNITINGECVPGASPNSAKGPYLTCNYNGTYKILTGCSCKTGFVQVNQTCQVDPKERNMSLLAPLITGILMMLTVFGIFFYCKKVRNTSPNLSSNHGGNSINTLETELFLLKEQPLLNVNPITSEQYDVFICYSSNDREWVKNVLLLELECRSIKACIDYRDFIVGAHIVENIADAIYNSRITIAVLSPDFIDSVYCKHELKAALSRIGIHKVIPVLYRPCTVPVDLTTTTYLDWCNDDIKPYFWDNLVKAILKETKNRIRIMSPEKN